MLSAKIKDSAIEVLRSATLDAHISLEKTLNIAKPEAGHQEYVQYISKLYSWLYPFENALWSAYWPEEIKAARRKDKSLWLAEDLHTVGIDPANIARSSFMPDLSNLPSRIGIAYVIEGSQLGTSVLARNIKPKLGGWSPRWLLGNGNDTSMLWREFLIFIENNLQTQNERRLASKTALEGFESLAYCFQAD